jgi:hypothetical protein
VGEGGVWQGGRGRGAAACRSGPRHPIRSACAPHLLQAGRCGPPCGARHSLCGC